MSDVTMTPGVALTIAQIIPVFVLAAFVVIGRADSATFATLKGEGSDVVAKRRKLVREAIISLLVIAAIETVFLVVGNGSGIDGFLALSLWIVFVGFTLIGAGATYAAAFGRRGDD